MESYKVTMVSYDNCLAFIPEKYIFMYWQGMHLKTNCVDWSEFREPKSIIMYLTELMRLLTSTSNDELCSSYETKKMD